MKTKTKKNDVLGVLNTLGIQVVTEGDREIACHCPFHADSHPSFSINATSGAWICFQCGEKGNLEHLIKAVKAGIDPARLLRPLKEQQIGRRVRHADVREEKPKYDPLIVRAEYEDFGLPPAWAVEDRFLSETSIARYGVKWNKGWIIPIWGPVKNDFWGWQYKRLDIVRNHPKGIKKGQTLFGLRELHGERIILVESPLDVVRLASAGVEGAVASFGAMVTRSQMQLLLEHSGRLVLALDNDSEGRKQNRKMLAYFRRYLPTTVFAYPEGKKDPGDYEDDEVECFHHV